MSIKFIPKQVVIQKCRSTGKWYARGISTGTVSTKKLARELSHSSSVTRADIVAVLYALAESIRNHLINSETVHLEGLGRLRVAVKSHVVEKKEDVNESLIYSYRVIFSPDRIFTATEPGPKGGRKGYYTKDLIRGVQAKKMKS